LFSVVRAALEADKSGREINEFLRAPSGSIGGGNVWLEGVKDIKGSRGFGRIFVSILCEYRVKLLTEVMS
jgi:hypothetical protein